MLFDVTARKILFLFVAQVILFYLSAQSAVIAADSRNAAPEISINKPLPNPVVAFTGAQKSQANGQNWIQYNLSVTNHAAYPNAMFAPAPNLPPCGQNAKASRTWVNIYTSPGLRKEPPRYIYGFCAFNSSDELVNLWFAVQAGQSPPSPVIVVLEDRQTKKNYVSNEVVISPVP